MVGLTLVTATVAALVILGSDSMQPKDPPRDPKNALQQLDWYFENGLLVYTAAYHLKRGSCCGSGCRHCPYEPRHIEGNTQVRS